MTATIKITAKRQATFPAALCRELGLKPGDSLRVEKRKVDDTLAWVMIPPKPAMEWLGGARKYAEGKSHDWGSIGASLTKAWAGEKGR